MIDRARVPILSLTLVLLSSVTAGAQTPVHGDTVVAAFIPNVQFEYVPQPVCDDTGVCGLFWANTHDVPEVNRVDILAAVLSPQGQLLVQPRVLATGHFPNGPIAVGLEHGFAVFWESVLPDSHISPFLQYFDSSLTPQGEATLLPLSQSAPFEDPAIYSGLSTIVRADSGFLLYATAVSTPSLEYDAYIYFVDRSGAIIRPRAKVNEGLARNANAISFGGLTVQPNGDLVAAYWYGDGATPSDIYLRRLAADGVPLGPEKLVSTDHTAIQSWPVLASGPDGAFLVAWQKAPAPGTPSHILARRFSADGQPLGDPFQVNNIHQLDQRRPAVTADAQGNYFIAWQSFYPTFPLYTWEVKGRLFRSDGAAVTGEIRLNLERQFEQEFPRVAFSSNGTVVVGWQSSSRRQRGEQGSVPVARTFAASPGQEVCVITGSRVSCDLARTGGEGELQFVWGGRPGEVTLLGDWDGDGRDDVCGYYLGRFRCDVNHAGRATVFQRLGQPGDIPLLADIDGDGRADPCIRRLDPIFCDTDRDGTAELKLTFGTTNGEPLLGDLDGDGKADFCLFFQGAWVCRTQAGEELAFRFGEVRDSPVLGDFDSSGRAEPCVVNREGALTCRSGGTLRLDEPTTGAARILFGNLDGL
jgi:hypothetical protein